MKFWWYDQPPNYGDILTPHILRNLGLPFKQARNREDCNALMVGSIAKWAKAGMHIFGSGFIRRADPVCKSASWHWVRGPISRQMVLNAGGQCPEIYGDAAFLLPEFWPKAEPIHDIGIVPHHVDLDIAQAQFPDLPIIDLLTTDPKETTRQITQCRKVISSSLHGLIVAHAYGIPAAWIQFSDRLHGDGMKFHDHFESMGMPAILSKADNPIFTVGSVDTRPMLEILTRCYR